MYSKSLELSAWFKPLIRKFVEKFSKFTMLQFAQNAFVIYLFNSFVRISWIAFLRKNATREGKSIETAARKDSIRSNGSFHRNAFLRFYLSFDRNNVLLSSPTPTLSIYRAFYCFRRSSWEAVHQRQTTIHKNNIFRVPLITTLGAACTQT